MRHKCHLHLSVTSPGGVSESSDLTYTGGGTMQQPCARPKPVHWHDPWAWTSVSDIFPLIWTTHGLEDYTAMPLDTIYFVLT